MKTTLLVALIACLGAMSEAAAVEVTVGGRLHLDYARYNADVRQLDNGMLLRRARLDMDGKLTSDWSFELAYDFANVYALTNTGTVKDGDFKEGFTDIALHYDGWKQADLNVGQTKVPFGLEELNSSNAISFIERALSTDAFAPSRRLGAEVSRNRDHYSVSVMGFGSSFDGRERGRGLAARATVTPIYAGGGNTVLHLGIAAVVERPTGEVKFTARPESRALDVRFLNTGKLADVTHVGRLGLEAAAKSGPLSLQAEWMQTAIKREGIGTDATLEGWYVMGSWVLTGESRQYSSGRFKGVPVQRPGGAWEVTARYSHLDLDNANVRGGEEDNLTLGVNYYASKHLRIMLNYIDVHSERRGKADSPQILLMRAQLAF